MAKAAEVGAGAIAEVDAAGSAALRRRAVVHLEGSGGVSAVREDSSTPVVCWGKVFDRPASVLPAPARHVCGNISNKGRLAMVGERTQAEHQD